ncbi:carbohydrate ABC transporter permease [Microvirga ossetica]|nr:sugar ABC transporter permease [Microvirga ossetica]
MSLFDWGIFGPNEFVGMDNYRSLVGDDRFWRAMRATFSFALIYVPLIVCVSLLIAVLLHRKLPGIEIFRTAFVLPIVINVAVAAIAIQWTIDPEIGILNRILTSIGLPGQAWLSQPGWALFAISLVTMWINSGFMIVIFLTGLENIPDELYEAARLDGSTSLQDLLYITVPLLKPITLLVTVLSLIHAFQVFGEVLIMTEGGPYGSTTVLTLLLYEEGFKKFALGRAAAIGTVITLIIAALSFIQFRVFREQ